MKEKILFLLLRAGLGTSKGEDAQNIVSLFAEKPEWAAVYRLSVAHGVVAIAWNGLERLHTQKIIPEDQLTARMLKLQWAYSVEQVQLRYERQYRTASRLAATYAEAGLQTFILKGIAVSMLYPIPQHRPCGDLDCFLLHQSEIGRSNIPSSKVYPRSDYEQGNCIAEQLGAEVDRDSYKHSHISFEGLMVENHQYCTAIRGSRRAKAFERELQRLLREERAITIAKSVLLSPSPLFTALFLTLHARTHLLAEGISLHHLVDWAMLIQRHAGDIDWSEFRRISELHGSGLYRFAQSMTRIAANYLGTKTVEALDLQPQKVDRLLFEDIIRLKPGLYNRGLSVWQQRFGLLVNYWQFRWRVQVFGDGSLLHNLWRLVAGFIFDRNPRL